MTAVGLDLSLGSLRPKAAVNLLVICPSREDHVKLREVCSSLSWNLHEAGTYHEALEYLGRYQIEIVICECVLPDGNWKDLLSIMAPFAESPRLIVISAHADDLLWAEVLNLGGYDVLAKPLKLQEVARTVALAWRNWKDEREKSKTAAPVAPGVLEETIGGTVVLRCSSALRLGGAQREGLVAVILSVPICRRHT